MRAPLSFAALVLAASVALAQANPRGEARLAVGGKSVAVEYGRPSLKGRDMLAKAQVGKPWRMGADAATTLRTEADLAFGKAVVRKGTYVLTATKLAEGQWNLIVNSPEGAVVAEIPLTSTALPESVEVLTIELTEKKGGGRFVMKWGSRALSADFDAK
jgi:hypothetical protein